MESASFKSGCAVMIQWGVLPNCLLHGIGKRIMQKLLQKYAIDTEEESVYTLDVFRPLTNLGSP